MLNKTFHMLMALLLFASAIALGLSTTAIAEDWPQFRGPNGSGVSKSTIGLPVDFGPEKNVVWKTALPPGHSSPVLTRDRIFVTAHTKGKDGVKDKAEGAKTDYKLLVICLDRETGKLLWQREVPRTHAGPPAVRQWSRVTQPGN